jgi:hypothetical protein
MPERRCYRYKGIWIPGCWARALNDTDCNCDPPSRVTQQETIDDLVEKVHDLEHWLARLEDDSS